MVEWRTNRRTRNPFPVAQGPDAIERDQLDEANEGEIVPQEEEQFICAACGKPFIGQAYEIEGQVICPECNRLDNKIQREEQRRQEVEDQPANALEESDNEAEGGLKSDDKGDFWGSGF